MDSRKCQTATASPAEPGGLSFWARDEATLLEINIMKRFDRDLRPLATTRLRVKGKLLSGDNPARIRDASEYSVLRATRDRIGWLTNAYEYIEFSPDGQETGRYPALECGGRAAFAYLALSERNVAIAAVGYCKPPGYWILNREIRQWERLGSVAADPLDWNTPLGFDSDALVVQVNPALIRRYEPRAGR